MNEQITFVWVVICGFDYESYSNVQVFTSEEKALQHKESVKDSGWDFVRIEHSVLR